MKAFIEIDSTNSYYDLDLLMYHSHIPNINENVEYTPVDGRNGTLTERQGTYPDRVLNFGFDLNRRRNERLEDFSDRLFYVEDVLSNCMDKNLVYYSNTNYKYVIKNIDINVVEDTFCHDIQLEITCEPFRYLNFETDILLDKHDTIYYRGTVPGECRIKIYGSGNVQLTINSETIQINNIDEYVELDSKLSMIIDKYGKPSTNNTIGSLLLLSRGENKVSWTGNVSRVTILPRTAYR